MWRDATEDPEAVAHKQKSMIKSEARANLISASWLYLLRDGRARLRRCDYVKPGVNNLD